MGRPKSRDRGVSPKALFSLAGAALGTASFLLPWVGFTTTMGTASLLSGESPAQLLLFLVAGSTKPSAANPAIVAWLQMVPLGYWLWVAGALLYAAGVAFVVRQSFAGSSWAGLEMLVGLVVALAGIRSLAASFALGPDLTLTVGPGYGLFFAVFAAFLAVVPIFRHKAQAEWARDVRNGEELEAEFAALRNGSANSREPPRLADPKGPSPPAATDPAKRPP